MSRLGTLAVAVAIAIVATLHYTAGHHDPASVHHLYRRLFYVPILAAAWGRGLPGGVTAAVAVILVYAPHAFGWLGAHPDPASTVDKVAEMILYLGIGGLVGLFVDRERGNADRLAGLLDDREATLVERDRALADLKAAQDSLVEAEHQAAMGFLTAGLAHEIRNPLGSIQGCAELLQDDDTDARQRERVGSLLVREARRLDDVLTRFLHFARQESGDTTTGVIGDLVDEVVELVGPEAERRGVAVQHVRCSTLPTTTLDHGGVRQVLLNLVVNALQVQDDGGSIRIVTGCDGAGGSLFVRVEDAGPGVPESERPLVFHPYYTTRPGGTGLGLAVSRRVIVEQGGSLQVGTAALGGASFEIRLPMTNEAPS